MGLAKIEDYTKNNLIELYVFVTEELQRTKNNANSSGFTKYSSVGSAVLRYRKELKVILEQVTIDLIEDFGFDKLQVNFDKEIQDWKDSLDKPVINDPVVVTGFMDGCMKKVWELDENSGIIAIDTYIVNYLAFDNANYLEYVLSKVSHELIKERLNILKNVKLKEDFIGSETEMQKAIAAFEIGFLKYKSIKDKGL